MYSTPNFLNVITQWYDVPCVYEGIFDQIIEGYINIHIFIHLFMMKLQKVIS